MLRVSKGRNRRSAKSRPRVVGPVVYVSTTGSDANNGSTRALAVASLSRASELVSPGHTVVVLAGTYTTVQSFWALGTAQKPITIQPDVGATVIFDGTSTATNTSLIDIGGAYVTFKGFTVRNAKRTGIQMWETTGCKIQNNTVYTCVKGGIWVGGGTPSASANNLISGNTVYDCVRENVGQALGGGGWAVAVQIDNSDGSVISSNVVRENYGEGVGILCSVGGRVIGNTVYDCFSVNIYLDNAQDAVCQNNRSYHNNASAYHRSGQGAAYGIIICNEVTARDLPSSGLTVTDNIVAGSPNSLAVQYSTFGSNTGLVSSNISPNTYYATPAAYFAAQ